MSVVFSHGRLRLYLLKVLADGPRHGYELIRLLSDRFSGLYAPSAGTIYPRLQRMEGDGLVTHTALGGRKVYRITDGGRAELAARTNELGALERDIQESIADLTTVASEVDQGVRGSASDLRRELREASGQVRSGRRRSRPRAERSAAERSAPGVPAPGVPAPGVPAAAPPAPTRLERGAAELLDEVRRLAASKTASPEAIRTATVVVETVLEQVRRLAR
jgi:DNA-binding PadR family transcriptional regulator